MEKRQNGYNIGGTVIIYRPLLSPVLGLFSRKSTTNDVCDIDDPARRQTSPAARSELFAVQVGELLASAALKMKGTNACPSL
jgi:hypothetical protein